MNICLCLQMLVNQTEGKYWIEKEEKEENIETEVFLSLLLSKVCYFYFSFFLLRVSVETEVVLSRVLVDGRWRNFTAIIKSLAGT